MRLRPLAMLGLSLGLTACAPTNSELEAEVDRATAAALPAISSEWRMASESGAAGSGWLASFNDPLLAQLVREAQENNLDLQVAAAGVEQARALARQAGADLSPGLGLSLGGERGGRLESGTGAASSGYSGGLQASWELDLWGRIRSGAAQATASAEAAAADFKFAQYSVAANTALAYFAIIEANLQTAIAEESLGLLRETLRIVEAQYNEGVASSQDLALTRSDLAAAQDRLIELEGSTREATRSMELLLGRYPSAELELVERLPAVPAPPAAGLPARVLEARPDLVAAEREVAAAFNTVSVARAARLPAVSLTAGLGGVASELTSLVDSTNVSWSAGTSLLAPILDGGRLRENVVIATAQQEAALANYANAALAAFSDVESALDQGQVLAARQAALEESAAQATEAYRIADLRYREGEVSLIDLLSVQQRVISARSSLVSINRLLLAQRVSLALALGDGWQ